MWKHRHSRSMMSDVSRKLLTEPLTESRTVKRGVHSRLLLVINLPPWN